MTVPATIDRAAAAPVSMLDNVGRFELAQRMANAFAASQLVPAHLRGKPADCLIALMMADQLRDNPLTVMQSIYFVGQKAGWATTYMIARANSSGIFKGRITWDVSGTGKDLTVTAKATLADTGEQVSATVSMQMAMAEGWTKNAKYQTMPDLMLRYRAATMLIRLYCPEVMMGMRTADEIEIEPQEATARAAINTASAAFDAFAAPPVDAEVIEAPAAEPAPAAASAIDWRKYADRAISDFAEHKTADALNADWADIRERLTNEDAPPEIVQALTTAKLEAERALKRGRK